MSKIRIITDSACDIPLKIELNNVEILNFFITVDGKSYEERKDISFREYSNLLETCSEIPKTAHITMMRYGERFEYFAAQGVTDIIVVTICGNSSATHDAAVMARDMFFDENPDAKVRIHILDSECFSMGYGWPIMKADRMIDKGAAPETVIDYLTNEFRHREILLTAYTLKYMKKSGRISAAAAFAGELLGLKPIILMDHGTTEVVQKVRGDKLVIPNLIAQFKKRAGNTTEYLIAYNQREDGKELYSACEKELGVPPKMAFELGSAVSTNAGNHCLAIVYTGE